MTAEPIGDAWLRVPRGRAWTWDDLQDTPDDGHRYEIIDGSLYMSPSPSRPHQLAASRLVSLLGAAAPPQLEALATVDVVLDRSVLVSDVVVLPADRAYSATGSLGAGDVLLAVEIVSPSSRRMDRLVKPSVLAEAGVPAYWRVELTGPGAPFLVAYTLVDGGYRETLVIRAGESAVVTTPFTVEVRPADLVGPRTRT